MESAQSEDPAEPTDSVKLPIVKQEHIEEEVVEDEHEKSSCANSLERRGEDDTPSCPYIEPCSPGQIVIGEGHHGIIDVRTCVGQELESHLLVIEAPSEASTEQCVPVIIAPIKSEPEQCELVLEVTIKSEPEQSANLVPVVIPPRRRRRSSRVPMVPSQHPMILRNRRSTMYNLRKLN